MYKLSSFLLAGVSWAVDEVIDLEEDISCTITNQYGTHVKSNFIVDQSQSDKCDESNLESKFCWNDQHLANGLIHHIDTDFYSKYVYNPSTNKYPLSPWLIIFVKDRYNMEKDHAEMMEYSQALLWESK